MKQASFFILITLVIFSLSYAFFQGPSITGAVIGLAVENNMGDNLTNMTPNESGLIIIINETLFVNNTEGAGNFSNNSKNVNITYRVTNESIKIYEIINNY